MDFQNKNQNFKSKFLDFLIRFLPIQSANRTKIDQLISFLYQTLDYLIILTCIVFQDENPIAIKPPNVVILTFQFSRVAANILYLITRKKCFLLLQAVFLLVRIMIFQGVQQMGFLALVIFDVLSAIIWSLTIQQKNIHFDSRLSLKNVFIKKVLVYVMVIYWLSIRKFLNLGSVFYLVVTLAIFINDKYDVVYNKKFKEYLLLLDICCLVSSVIPILFSALGKQLSLANYLILILINVTAISIYSYVSQDTYPILFSVDPWQTKVEEQELVQFFIALQGLIKSGSESKMNDYLLHHVRFCNDQKCCLLYHFKIYRENPSQLHNIFALFLRDELTSISKRSKAIQQYVIYNSSDQVQIFNKYLDNENFFHRREHSRFMQKFKDMNKSLSVTETSLNKNYQFIMEIDITSIVHDFVNLSLQFWQELMEYRIDAKKVGKVGKKYVGTYEKLKDIAKSKIVLNEKSRISLQICFQYILKQKDFRVDNQFRIQHNLEGFVECLPTIAVSAQKQNFLSILDANVAFLNCSGYTKNQLLRLTVDYFWDKQIRTQHIQVAEKRAKYNDFSSNEVNRSYAFLKNKFGYVVLVDGKIYCINDVAGKKWCVVLQPYLAGQPIFVLNSKRELIGINQLCLGQGMRKQLQGYKMDEQFFNESVGIKNGIKVGDKELFVGSNFRFKSNDSTQVVIKLREEIGFLGKVSFYIYSIRREKAKQSDRYISKRGDDDISRAYDNRASKVKNDNDSISNESFQQKTIITNTFKVEQPPSFQFTFDKHTLFYNGTNQNDNHTSPNNEQDVGGEIDFIEEDKTSYEFVKYDEDIIEMRLWRNELDFIENMEVANVNFEAIHQSKIKFVDMTPQQLKEDFQIRSKKNPKILLIFWGFIITLLVSVSIFVTVVSVRSSIAKKQFETNFESDSQMFNHLGNLYYLSATLIGNSINSSINVNSSIKYLNTEIQTLYTQMQTTIPNFNTLTEFSVNGTALKKVDDIYRLLINNYILTPSNASRMEAFAYYLNTAYPGWIGLLNEQMQQYEMNEKKFSNDNTILISLLGFMFIVFFFFFMKLSKSLLGIQYEFCGIFSNIDHLYIVSEVAKLKSFKNLLDCNETLLDEETILSIRNDSNYEKIHQKKLVNKNKDCFYLIFIILIMLLMATYFAINSYFSYVSNDLAYDHFKIVHKSYGLSNRMNVVWVALNFNHSDLQTIGRIRGPFEDLQREMEIKMLKVFKAPLAYPEDLKILLVEFLLGDLCPLVGQPVNCSLNLYGTQKRGNKQLNSKYLRNIERIARRNYNLTGLINSIEYAQIYEMQRFYFRNVSKVLSSNVKTKLMNMLSEAEEKFRWAFLSLGAGFVLAVFFTIGVSVAIKQTVKLETVLTWVDFDVLKCNRKFIKFIKQNRLTLR